MKSIYKYSLVLAIALITLQTASAQKIAEATFKVSGNCEMCKERIEGALDVKGVKQATWNMETQMLKVVYRTDKHKVLDLHKLVAAVGHSTDKVKAKEEAYQKLPHCCMYNHHKHE